MRLITACLLSSLSALCLVAPTPGNAATIRQDFEVTVTGFGFRAGDNPDPTSIDLPPIGTKGFGSYAYDESQLNYIDDPRFPVGYYLGRPGDIAFSDFSLNFFNRTYTKRVFVGSRVGEIFLFNRTPSGQYTPRTLILNTSDDETVVRIIGNTFVYIPSFSAENGIIGSANGTLRFTDAKSIPEPSFVIAPFFALGIGWLYQRKRTAQKNF